MNGCIDGLCMLFINRISYCNYSVLVIALINCIHNCNCNKNYILRIIIQLKKNVFFRHYIQRLLSSLFVMKLVSHHRRRGMRQLLSTWQPQSRGRESYGICVGSHGRDTAAPIMCQKRLCCLPTKSMIINMSQSLPGENG